jgi:hypothetical protein
MATIPKNHHNSWSADFSAIFKAASLAALLLVIGCSAANYGTFKHSRGVKQAFETYHVYPEHRYYYLHLENDPYAVMALQKDYTIADKQWTEFNPQTDTLEKVVELIERFPVPYSYAYGSYLKDSLGNQIGYWYSSLRIRNLKVDNEARRVSILTDKPWLRDEENGLGTRFGFGIGPGNGGIGIGIGNSIRSGY